MKNQTDYRLEVLARLADTVHDRRSAAPDESYSARLISRGVAICAKKLGEEAVEVAIAAVTGDPEALTSEAADLLYHLVVLLEAAHVPLNCVMAVLEQREGTSGLVEKAQRPAS